MTGGGGANPVEADDAGEGRPADGALASSTPAVPPGAAPPTSSSSPRAADATSTSSAASTSASGRAPATADPAAPGGEAATGGNTVLQRVVSTVSNVADSISGGVSRITGRFKNAIAIIPPASRAVAPAADGQPGLADEVTALRAHVNTLELELERLRGIVRQARDIIVTTDLEGRVTDFNEEAEHVLGWRASDVLGKTADHFYAARTTRQRVLDLLEREPSGVVREDVEVRTRSGERRWLNLSLSWLVDADGERIGTVGVSKDVTSRRQLEDELRRLSVTDKLTGLFNQAHFFHRLEVEKERALRLKHDLSLLLFDLDHFKRLNDTQGHSEGDKVLLSIGRILFETIRKEVDSAFRYGGDEFTVLLPGADGAQAVRFADRVRRRIEELDMGGVRASLGVCPFDPQNRALQVLEKADEAMYLSKRAGGNRVAAYDLALGAVALCDLQPATGAYLRPPTLTGRGP